jgi:NodT family efflux transporter outer membrane factor (OMF) lipoprotein
MLLVVSVEGAANENSGAALPAAFREGAARDPSEKPYWLAFNDAILDGLIETALEGNFDIASAKHRIAQAEAVARQTLAPLLPSVSAEASWSMGPVRPPGLSFQIPPTLAASMDDGSEVKHTVSTLLKASYLVDITGRSYRSRQAALKDAAASRADAETQAATLVGLIVQAYYDVVDSQRRLALVKQQIANNEALLKLVETRFRTGASNALDVLQQRQQLEATRAQLPLVRALIDSSRQQLAALTGTGNTDSLPKIEASLPPIEDVPAVGTPERLLGARPDLRAAGDRLEALTDRESVARRTLLPSLALNGYVGYQMSYVDDVDDGEVWSLGAALTIPLYEGGANWAALKAAKAAKLSASAALRQSALDAHRQVETALISEREQRKRLAILREQAAAAELTFNEARKRYLVGLSEYLNVLAALGTYQIAQIGVLQAERDVLSARIQLMNALGGDWTRRILNGNGD